MLPAQLLLQLSPGESEGTLCCRHPDHRHQRKPDPVRQDVRPVQRPHPGLHGRHCQGAPCATVLGLHCTMPVRSGSAWARLQEAASTTQHLHLQRTCSYKQNPDPTHAPQLQLVAFSQPDMNGRAQVADVPSNYVQITSVVDQSTAPTSSGGRRLRSFGRALLRLCAPCFCGVGALADHQSGAQRLCCLRACRRAQGSAAKSCRPRAPLAGLAAPSASQLQLAISRTILTLSALPPGAGCSRALASWRSTPSSRPATPRRRRPPTTPPRAAGRWARRWRRWAST